MKIEFYKDADYQQLIALYETSKQFPADAVTDSKEGLFSKISRDPESVLLAKEDNKLIGSVSIIEDGRIALLFRLVVSPESHDQNSVLKLLVSKSEEILKEKGYKEVHNTSPSDNEDALSEREILGFKKGSEYTWFWKSL